MSEWRRLDLYMFEFLQFFIAKETCDSLALQVFTEVQVQFLKILNCFWKDEFW
jgi:hypothetical protein